jgi:hypothetical protein
MTCPEGCMCPYCLGDRFAYREQPAPVANQHEPSWGVVIRRVEARRDRLASMHLDHRDLSELAALMRARDDLGAERYGVRLQPFNGRDSIRDALEEVLDLCVYLQNVSVECPQSYQFAMMRGEVEDLALRIVAERRRLAEASAAGGKSC